MEAMATRGALREGRVAAPRGRVGDVEGLATRATPPARGRIKENVARALESRNNCLRRRWLGERQLPWRRRARCGWAGAPSRGNSPARNCNE
eukprot:9665593-Alexandrium_andersonii.AAC.1